MKPNRKLKLLGEQKVNNFNRLVNTQSLLQYYRDKLEDLEDLEPPKKRPRKETNSGRKSSKHWIQSEGICVKSCVLCVWLLWQRPYLGTYRTFRPLKLVADWEFIFSGVLV